MRPVPGRFGLHSHRRSRTLAARPPLIDTVLNAINQGDIVLTAEQPQWLKVALTYAVPFFVSSYAAYRAARVQGQRLGRRAAAGRRLKRRARPTRHWQLAAGT